MSVDHYHAVWWCAALTGNVKLVALRLAWSANDEGLCYPALGKVAKFCGITRQTVSEHVARLASDELGVLTLEAPAGHGRRTATYRFNLEALRALPRVEVDLSEKPTGGGPDLSGNPTATCRETRHDLSGNPTRNDRGRETGKPISGARAAAATADADAARSPDQGAQAEGPQQDGDGEAGGEPGSQARQSLRQTWLGLQADLAARVGAARHAAWIAPLIPWGRLGNADGTAELVLVARHRMVIERVERQDRALGDAIRRAWASEGGAGVRVVLPGDPVAEGAERLPPSAFEQMQQAALRAVEAGAVARAAARG